MKKVLFAIAVLATSYVGMIARSSSAAACDDGNGCATKPSRP